MQQVKGPNRRSTRPTCRDVITDRGIPLQSKKETPGRRWKPGVSNQTAVMEGLGLGSWLNDRFHFGNVVVGFHRVWRQQGGVIGLQKRGRVPIILIINLIAR